MVTDQITTLDAAQCRLNLISVIGLCAAGRGAWLD
jgi:hypothetical protein